MYVYADAHMCTQTHINTHTHNQILGRALHQLHEIGLVLRDIKPPNILLDAYDQPVFADFGIAVIVSSIAHTPWTSIVGTFNYMAPEAFEPQAFAEGIGPHTDVWALACVMVEMLTGQKPWVGMQMQQISRAVCDQHATPLVPEDAPGAHVLRQCFARLPAQRTTTAEFAQSFASIRHARRGIEQQDFRRRLAAQEAITEDVTNVNSVLTQEIEQTKLEMRAREQHFERLVTELAIENSRLQEENLILKSLQDLKQTQENSHEPKVCNYRRVHGCMCVHVCASSDCVCVFCTHVRHSHILARLILVTRAAGKGDDEGGTQGQK
jgi:serine/threonine protein kinase